MGSVKLTATQRKAIIRELAEAGQEALYHDIDPSMPEYKSGVETLERVFSRILRGKLKLAGRAALEEKP